MFNLDNFYNLLTFSFVGLKVICLIAVPFWAKKWSVFGQDPCLKIPVHGNEFNSCPILITTVFVLGLISQNTV